MPAAEFSADTRLLGVFNGGQLRSCVPRPIGPRSQDLPGAVDKRSGERFRQLGQRGRPYRDWIAR